jgi:hypothetical protein
MSIQLDKYEAIKAKLEAYAKEFEDLVFWDWPTIRQAARKFRVKQDLILDMVDDSECLDLVAGFRSGAGYGTLAKADQRIEYYEN